jgi:nicotinate-nucleotide pyrophosphorylase (carboxylating)
MKIETIAPPLAQEVDRIIETALIEDVGAFDVTSLLTITEDAEITFAIKARQKMIICGTEIAAKVFDKVTHGIHKYIYHAEGSWINPGDIILSGQGNARAIFAAERVALNLLRHTCGVATITRQFVDKIADTNTKILDTRKTIPGLREIQKYAVRVGGGTNHRYRLDDGVLIKDNHISVCGSVTEALKRAKSATPAPTRIEIECDTLAQVKEAIEGNADIILLDNMSVSQLQEAVALVRGQALLEASGNMNLENVKEVAQSGVDFISVGAITHSTPNVDIGLDLD